ncbi:alginate export family protein [Colwellia sp. BRX10-4]|uniref:alginate export family protein n=1 Tax=Colwellia sp. BRX10-4 TaxID=2759843 RepID=UPI0021751C75|nr:alginate export family protein [Colwellia sp. BRX10-4]
MMKFTKKKLSLALIASSIISAPFAMADDAPINSGIKKALTDSKVKLSLRAHYEGVDEDGANGATDKDATALTVKSRLTLQTGDYKSWSLGLEVDNVTAIVDDYNDLTFDYSGSDAVVADPEITDVNQAFLQYRSGKVKLTAGRQRILHNNQRFIGGVGWRQNEQTYDGYRIEYTASATLSLDYSYIYNANRIFGDDKKGDDLSGAFHFANATYKINTDTKYQHLLMY